MLLYLAITHDGEVEFDIFAVVSGSMIVATEWYRAVVVTPIFSKAVQIVQICFEKILKLMFSFFILFLVMSQKLWLIFNY